VAESDPIGHARRSRRERPWLRLVRADPDDLGPVSPELVLVDPPLAAAVRVTPDAVVVDNGRAKQTPSSTTWERPRMGSGGGGRTTTARYDTRDLLLERHGLRLELATRGAERSWRLTAARGERVVVPDSGSGVPAQIESLLRSVVNGRDLVEVPTRSSDPEIRRLEDHVAKQHRSLLRHDVGTRIASDPESLHQVRVAARRVRAFLAVARDLVDGEWAAEVKEGMREVGEASNEARDVDILLEKLRAEIRSLDLRDRSAAEALIGRLEDDRRELQRAVVAALDSDRYQQVLEQLALPAMPAAERPEKELEQLAARELRRLVSRVRRLGKRPPDDALHTLRIKVKRVRYAMELGGRPSRKRTRRVIAAATQMQDLLGAHQDAVAAGERLRAAASALDETGIAFVAGQLAERERVKRTETHDRVPTAWRELRRLAKKLD
jgi:CHAD domain-containing protein